MARIGKWIALVGAIIVIGVFAYSGWSVGQQAKVRCGPDPLRPPSAEAIVYSPQKIIGVNGVICIAWKPSKLFSGENMMRADLMAALMSAQAREMAARSALDQLNGGASTADRGERQTEFETAQQKRIEAQARLDALATQKSLTLFIADTPTPVAFPAYVEDYPGWRWKLMRLRVPEDGRSADARTWRELLSSLSSGRSHSMGLGDAGLYDVTLGLGDTGATLPRKGAIVDGIWFRVFDLRWLLLGAVGLMMLMVGVVLWGWRSGFLRNRHPVAETDPDPPFSLARVQMAWWFLLTLGGYLFIWLLTGQSVGVLTTGVVAFLGISGVSGAAAITVDAVAPGQGPAEGEAPAPSRGFFTDILTNQDGVELHRVQMLVWTVILGATFAWSVVWTYTFPLFDEAMVLMAGVVSGVYVGFKLPENSST